MAAMRMPRTLLTIWLVRPWPMKPAPTMPTRIALPCASWAASARSTMIMFPLLELRPAGHARRGQSPLLRRYELDRHPALQLGLDLIEPRPGLVLVGDLADRQRPREAKPRIVPGETALGSRRVELAHLIAGLRPVFERLVPVPETLGDVERAMVVGAQLDGDVLEVGRALGPEVDDDVQDRPAGRADELRLRSGRVLEVHPPHRSLALVEGDVRLRDHRLEAVIGELALAERAGEEAAVVLAALDVDDEGAPEPGFGEDHAVPTIPSSTRVLENFMELSIR